LLLESISSAYFSISLEWICTFAAVKAGVSSPPATRAAAAACESDVGAAAVGADGCATGIDCCGV
jgi:hypothetical protein